MEELRRYARKARPDEVLVRCVLDSPSGSGRDQARLIARLDETGRRHGFRLELSTDLDAPGSPAAISHLIVVRDVPFDGGVTDKVASALGKWGSASIAFAYPSRGAMLAAEPAIEDWKARAGPALNFLFPDEMCDGRLRVSDAKIADNAVCDTVRVKYLPRPTGRAISLPPTAERYFRAASELYEREHLHLRAPTDGYFATRVGDGFLITATRTSKVALDLSRISLVHDYDEASGELTYSGTFLPSSDAVEAAVLLRTLPAIDFLLHSHASRLFTRNPAWEKRVLVPQLPYGEPALGHAVASALTTVGDGFVIMAEHGEVFAGQGDAAAFFDGIARRCEQARLGLGDV